MIKLLQVFSVMKCPAYSIMNIVWHTVQFLQVRTEEVWKKILQELGQCGCLWSLMLGGIMKSCCGHLSQMFVNFSISHSMCCAPSGTPWKVFHFAIIWSRNSITIENILSFYTMEHLRWLLCSWLWDICTVQKILVVGIKISLPIVKCLCHFFLG